MLGSEVHNPVGASPLRPDRVLRTNRAGVLLDLGPLCVLPEYAVRQMRPAPAVLTVSSRSAGRVFSLWACPPSPYRPRGRPRWASGAAFALPMLHGVVFVQSFAWVYANRTEFCPWGCFPAKLCAPVQPFKPATVAGVCFVRAQEPHNTPRQGFLRRRS